jgi:hypothetical protein
VALAKLRVADHEGRGQAPGRKGPYSESGARRLPGRRRGGGDRASAQDGSDHQVGVQHDVRMVLTVTREGEGHARDPPARRGTQMEMSGGGPVGGCHKGGAGLSRQA